MKWTEQQESAIRTGGKDILVSAAAGSGKTAVLTERIKRLIIEKGISIDNMLIVTFSNAAAAEMKEKIIRALKQAADDEPERAVYLRAQVRRARVSDISTFHKFSMGVIRRYFYLTETEQNFGICDEGRRRIMIEETLDELIRDRFECGSMDDAPEPPGAGGGPAERADGCEPSMSFREFLRRYADVRSEDTVRTMTDKLYSFIMSMPDPFEWLHDAVESINSSEEDFRSLPVYAAYRKDVAVSAAKAADIYRTVCDSLADLPGLLAKAEADMEHMTAVAEAAESGSDDELESALNFEFKRFIASKDEKEEYSLIKDMVTSKREKAKEIINDIRASFCTVPLSDAVGRIRATYESARYLEELVKDFHRRFTEKKREKNLLDFNDIEHTALEILRHEETAEEYRKQFEVIFVDEYQDSSLLQETLIQQISRGDNVYMVGDVKQSIYKFRLAEPEIFINKYNDFREGSSDGIRIDLNMNFRSKGNIIKAVNAVFANIMNRDTCGIDYDDDASLKKGTEYEGILDRRTSLHLIDTDLPEEGEREGIDEKIINMQKTELEARIAAKEAAARIGSEIFDSKQNRVRKITPDDIVILLRDVKGQADVYASALSDAGIPAYVESGEGYFETTEIEVFMNLLRIIDNRRSDMPLISVLYSPIFSFTVDELIRVRLWNRDAAYHEAFISLAGLSCCQSGGEKESHPCDAPGASEELCGQFVPDAAAGTYSVHEIDGADSEDYISLAEKCRRVCSDLDRWGTYARFMPLESFLWLLMKETCYLDYVTALPGGDRRAANLRSLVDKAVDFSSSGTKGLFAFLRYIEAINKGSVEIGQALQSRQSGPMVRIMTIHKSKGLEFPVVILSGLGRKFKGDKNTLPAAMHRELGLALKYSDPDRHCSSETLSRRVIKARKDRERMAEEMRVLYVAMTRPKDELIMTGTVSGLEERLEKYRTGLLGDPENPYCPLDWIIPYCKEGDIEIIKHERASISADEHAGSESAAALMEELRSGFPSFHDEKGLSSMLAERFSYKYPYEADVSSKSKFTVSGLNRALRGEAVSALPGPVKISPVNNDEETEVREEEEELLETEFAVPRFMKDETGVSALTRGTLTHRVLELIPFEREYGINDIEDFVKGLPSSGYMTESEASAVDCRKIASFFSSETGKRACRASWLRKEWPFTLKKSKEEIVSMAATEEIAEELRNMLADDVLIQGIIDCCFRDDGGIVIVDYKTDRVDRKYKKESINRLKEEYRRQLELYSEVIEKATGEAVSRRILFLLDSGDEVII